MRRFPVIAVLLLSACATMRSISALRQVDFSIQDVVSIDLAGIQVERVRGINDLNFRDATRLAAALARSDVPLSFIIHIRGENPADNRVTARLVRFTWTLALNGRETISGALDTAYAFAPGAPTVVALPVSLNLYQFFRSNARDLFEIAAGLSGAASRPTEITLRATPILDTPIGAITYPNPILIAKRTVGGPQ